LDFDRPERIGLGEAIYCTNKSVSQMETIVNQILEHEAPTLFTRMEPAVFDALEATFPGILDYDAVSRTAICGEVPVTGDVTDIAVITAGSTDVPVSREAIRTLGFYGENVLEINDLGVAGLWRLQKRLPDFRDKRVLICVAGMDAALPTLVGGLVGGLVIAVPTSNGYGVARGGETALHALLCSCAPGLAVVNIDNGFGAACVALRSIRAGVGR
jgi:NCAIR mutase (PurE)-related protein